MSTPLVVEPQQLSELLPQDNILVVDLQSPENYRQGHLPGALHVNPAELMGGERPAPGLLPSRERLEDLFSRLGLSPEHHVVVYDDEGGGWAGRFIWTLDVIGHPHYSYLNGGIHAWRDAELPEQQQACEAQPRALSLTLNREVMVDKEELKTLLEQGAVQVWDARSPMEFRGEKVLAERAGHMPGAINCEWTSLMDRQRQLRIREDARDYLASLGLTAQQPIVTHCQSHHRSGFTYLVGKFLGFDIKAYPGSWSEWGNCTDTPIER